MTVSYRFSILVFSLAAIATSPRAFAKGSVGGLARACENYAECRHRCEVGDSNSCTSLADAIIRDKGDRAEAVVLLEKACNQGYVHGCSKLGFRLIEKSHQHKDVARAITLFEKACAAHDPLGCSNLATFLYDGEGIAKNLERAAKLYADACERRDGFSCSVLGTMYANGDGVDKDRNRALKLYQRACELGSPNGCTALGLRILSGDSSVDGPRAVALFEKACSGDDGAGCLQLARCVERGDGTAKDAVRARKLFRKACELGITTDNACARGGASPTADRPATN
jgi:uncharacterized protein